MRVLALAVPAVVAATLGWAAPATAAACDQPYAPFATGRAGSGQPYLPSSSFPVERTLDHFELVSGTTPDTDGDGRAEVVEPVDVPGGLGLVLRRPAGDVTFLPPAGAWFVSWDPQAAGDLDADGRDEVVLRVGTGSLEAGFAERVVVVPGTVPAGVHDPDAVGIRLAGPAPFLVQVGDHDGDGGEDLAVGIDIVSGRRLLAAGPGGTADVAAAVVGRFPESDPGLDGALLRLDPAAPPVRATMHVVGDGVEVLIASDPPVRLRAAVPETQRFGLGVRGFVSGGHRIVTATVSNRGGSEQWLWDLDDPCRAWTHVVREGSGCGRSPGSCSRPRRGRAWWRGRPGSCTRRTGT